MYVLTQINDEGTIVKQVVSSNEDAIRKRMKEDFDGEIAKLSEEYAEDIEDDEGDNIPVIDTDYNDHSAAIFVYGDTTYLWSLLLCDVL